MCVCFVRLTRVSRSQRACTRCNVFGPGSLVRGRCFLVDVLMGVARFCHWMRVQSFGNSLRWARGLLACLCSLRLLGLLRPCSLLQWCTAFRSSLGCFAVRCVRFAVVFVPCFCVLAMFFCGAVSYDNLVRSCCERPQKNVTSTMILAVWVIVDVLDE